MSVYGLTQSLSSTCINVIAENIESFMFIEDFNGKVPRWHLEYLQRSSSQTLLDTLKKMGKDLNARHARFLINPFLKHLDLDVFCNSDLSEVFEILSKNGKGIASIICSGCSYSKDVLLQLACSLPASVISLSMAYTRCTDEVMRKVSQKCPKLQDLYLDHCFDITDMGIQAFCVVSEDGTISENSVIQYLNICSTPVTEGGIAFALKNFCNLVTLSADNIANVMCTVHEEDYLQGRMSEVKKYSLKEFVVDPFTKLLPNSLHVFTLLCPNVTDLYLSQIRSPTELQIIEQLTNLQCVHFMFNGAVSVTSFLQARGQKLKELHLWLGTICVESLVKYCPKMQVLFLQGTEFEELKLTNGSVKQSVLYDLKEMHIQYLNLSIVAKPLDILLAASPNVTLFGVCFTSLLNENFVNFIAKHEFLSSLRVMDVSHSDINVSVARKLLETVPNLNTVFMNEVNILSSERCQLTNIRRCTFIKWTGTIDRYCKPCFYKMNWQKSFNKYISQRI